MMERLDAALTDAGVALGTAAGRRRRSIDQHAMACVRAAKALAEFRERRARDGEAPRDEALDARLWREIEEHQRRMEELPVETNPPGAERQSGERPRGAAGRRADGEPSDVAPPLLASSPLRPVTCRLAVLPSSSRRCAIIPSCGFVRRSRGAFGRGSFDAAMAGG
jgi:hypothetical protein